MPSSSSNDTGFVVIVEFKAEPSELGQAIIDLTDYIAAFLSHQSGFIESFLQHDEAGGIVHVARWRGEEDFRAFAAAAADHLALPGLRRLSPKPRFLKPVGHFLPPGSTEH